MNNDFEIQREAIIEIVGTQYEGRAVNHFGLNEHQKLIIKHQPDNSHDSNAVMILTEDGKELGFIPKGYASIYAPAIESNRYSFSAEVVKTEQDPYRPILIIKVIAEYNSNGEEETEKSIIELVKDIVDGFASAKEKYNGFIYSDTVDVNALAVTLNKARLMYKLFQRSSDLMTDIIKENHIIENSSSDKQLSADSLKETVCDLKEDVRNILKKIQKEYNEAYELEIDNEDEYLRVQTEMRERRKKFRAYDGMLNSFIEAIEGYTDISLIVHTAAVNTIIDASNNTTAAEESDIIESSKSKPELSTNDETSAKQYIKLSDSGELEFYYWLTSSKNFSTKDAQNCISDLHELEKLYKMLFGSKKDVFKVKYAESIEAMKDSLALHPEYTDNGIVPKQRYETAISLLMEFMSSSRALSDARSVNEDLSVFRVDFSDLDKCTSNKPYCFRLNGNEIRANTWRTLYNKLLIVLYSSEEYQKRLRNLIGKTLYGREIDFADNRKSLEFRNPIRVAEDFYAAGNYSAVATLQRVKWLKGICGISDNQLEIFYIKRKADDNAPVNALAETQIINTDKTMEALPSDIQTGSEETAEQQIVQNAVSDSETRVESINDPKDQNDEQRVDFSMPYDYAGYRPYRFIYNGDEFPAKNWIDLYKKFLMLVYTTDEKSKVIIQDNYNKAIYHGMVIFSPTEKSPFRTGSLRATDGLYIEKKLSYGEVIKRIEFVMTLCGIPKEKIEIYCLARSARNTADDSFEEQPEPEKDEHKEFENVQTDNNKDERAAAEQIIAEVVSPGFKPDLSKSFSLKEALVEILSCDAPEINQYKNEKNGICVDDFINILKKYYKKSKERFVISRRLIEDDDFRSVGLEYYTLSDRKLSSLSKNEKTQQEYIPADEHSQPAPAPSKELTAELIADIIKENCGELQYKDGFGTYEIKNLLARKGVTGISEDAIETLMSECPQLKEIEDGYYMPREAEDKPSLSKQESYPKEEAVSESTADDRHIILKINGEPVRAYDCSEALVKACEFAINCRPFKMARIAGQDITLKGERVFYRKSIPVEGYNKLSNELQVMPVNSIDDLKMVIDKIKDYCQIDDSMITVISR